VASLPFPLPQGPTLERGSAVTLDGSVTPRPRTQPPNIFVLPPLTSISEKVKLRVWICASAVPVLAVDDSGFLGMHF
jgi:hypothetical protein